MSNDRLSATDLRWIERSQSYLWQFAPWLVIWIIAAVWIVWRKKFPLAASFFFASISVGAYLYLNSVMLMIAGPVPSPRAAALLRWTDAVTVGWAIVSVLSTFGSLVYGVLAINQLVRSRRIGDQ
jgi:hypothetical protein